MALFGRYVAVDLGTEGATGRRVTGFHTQFHAIHTRTGEPSSCVVRISNLAPGTVALAQQPQALIRVIAGYETPLQVFMGTPVKNGVRVEKEGTDRILHMELQDGGRQYRTSRINLTMATGTTLQQAWEAVQTQLGLPPGVIQLGGLASLQLSQGLTMVGPVRDVLDRLAASLGVRWFIRDGTLCVLSTDETSGEVGPVFSPTSRNLIGSPELTDEGIKATALLQPGLRPGMAFRIDGASVGNGDWNATRVEHIGDSGWEQDFYTVAEGRARRV